MRAIAPSATVAAVTVLLLVTVLVAAPRVTPPDGPATNGERSTLDYSARPHLEIPRLEASFIREQLAAPAPSIVPAVRRAPAREPTGTPPAPRTPTPTPTPTPANPIIPGTGEILITMTVDRTQASAGGLVVYTVTARNTGDAAVTTVFVTNTHAPRFTVTCTQSGEPVCTIPGDYDGSSRDPNDPHIVPAQTEQTRTIPARGSVVIRTLRVQVVDGAPSGTKLFNHAHVDVVGDGRAAQTYVAPEVIVR